MTRVGYKIHAGFAAEKWFARAGGPGPGRVGQRLIVTDSIRHLAWMPVGVPLRFDEPIFDLELTVENTASFEALRSALLASAGIYEETRAQAPSSSAVAARTIATEGNTVGVAVLDEEAAQQPTSSRHGLAVAS